LLHKLGMIHTVTGLVPVFEGLREELIPDVKCFNIADEALLSMVTDAQGLTPAIYRRVVDDAVTAETAGADVILVTCSSISPCVDVAKNMVSVPVLKIDEPMVDEAISIGKRIGVAATARTTLKPTTELIRVRSMVAEKDTAIDAVFCEGAFDALMYGETERHDRIVRDHLHQMMQNNDVVVLAQASMARVADQIPDSEKRVPILSSPRLGMQRVRDVFNQLEKVERSAA
jgi:Asp/Glu/hydantoin racemase